MTVLIADKLDPSVGNALQKAGLRVVEDGSLKEDSLTAAIKETGPNILIVRGTKVPAVSLDASKNLELIVRAGAGYDTIDVDGASERGIFVANCPGKNADAVAELTIGHMISLDRRLPENVADSRRGVWNKGLYSKASGLKGKTLGLIGLGSIGSSVARIAKSMGMHVVAWSRSLTENRAVELGVGRKESAIAVAAVADVISVHVASTPETRNMIDSEFLSEVRPGSILINTSRAEIVDEQALLEAVEKKSLRVAVDVFSGEPNAKEAEFESELARRDGIYISHHIGASTAQAQQAIAEEALRVALGYYQNGVVRNCINLAEQTPATHQITVRHKDKVGVLASVLNVMSEAGWNVQEMENLIFAGAKAACARITFDGTVSENYLNRISEIDDVFDATVVDL